ncbi:hypothetical protein Tco_1152260 [Tanacetum coccineum]
MNTTKAQQKSLDDALVSLVDCLKFGKCNMRLKTDINPKEATFQVVLDALALTPFYQAFLITIDDKSLKTSHWNMIFSLSLDILGTLEISFISLISPFKIENKDAKKTNKMSYPRFTKIIIDYFMSKDQYKDTQKAPKPKYIRKKYDSDTSPKKKTVQATEGTRLKSKAKVAKSNKKKQPAKMPKAKGLNVLSKVALTEVKQMKLKSEEESWTFSQDDKDAEQESDRNDDSEETKSDNDEDDLTHPNLSTYKADEEEEEEEKAADKEVSFDKRVSTPPNYELTEEQEEEYKEDDDKDKEVVQQQSSSVLSDLVSKFINPSLDIGIDSILNQDTQVSALESKISEFRQTSQFAEAVSSILGIFYTYLASKRKEAVDVVDSTMKAIIKEQVQAQVSKIMPKIEKYITESLGAEVLVISTNQPQTSYAKNLYNALVESYNTDKDIITSYGDVVTLKRGRDDQDKDEDPSVGSNRGSKIRRSGKEAESTKEPKNKESMSTSSSKSASKYQPKSLGKSAHAEEHDQKAADLEDQPYQEFNT